MAYYNKLREERSKLTNPVVLDAIKVEARREVA